MSANEKYTGKIDKQYVSMDDKAAVDKLTKMIVSKIKILKKNFNSITIINIGTDRITGDSLGPLVGSKLKDKLPANITCLGNLDNPIHAKNLVEYVNSISKDSLVIAVDACLGRMDHVGNITVAAGSMKPGTGVDKMDLPYVGDISIAGIVNYGGFMEFLVLQNTRLSVVMKMADIISESLQKAIVKVLTPTETILEQAQTIILEKAVV